MAKRGQRTEDVTALASRRGSAQIGPRLAAARKLRGLKVTELARKAGVSSSMVSQIERGQALPSVSSLYALAEAVEVPVESFFGGETQRGDPERANAAGLDDPQVARLASRPGRAEQSGGAGPGPWALVGPPAPRRVVRRDQREALQMRDGVVWQWLNSPDLVEAEILEITYEPGAASGEFPYRHAGREVVVVLEGRLVVEVLFDRYELEAGDSLTFESTDPHRYANPFESKARALCTVFSCDRLDG